MDKFLIGESYGVLHMDDRDEMVTIASRDERRVTLTDGRSANILHGQAPDSGTEEVLRVDERGAVAHGGVVRVCQLRAAAAMASERGRG